MVVALFRCRLTLFVEWGPWVSKGFQVHAQRLQYHKALRPQQRLIILLINTSVPLHRALPSNKLEHARESRMQLFFARLSQTNPNLVFFGTPVSCRCTFAASAQDATVSG